MKSKISFGRFFSSLLVLFFLAACGDPPRRVAGFDIDMSRALNDLNLESLRVTGSVWNVDKKGKAAQLIRKERETEEMTIRGNYPLEVGNLEEEKVYEFRVKIFYRAADFDGGRLSETGGLPPQVELFSPSLDRCPEFNLTPDASLVEGRWLLLCEARVHTRFKAKDLIQIGEEDLKCQAPDADGDGMANLTELDREIQPFNGDVDGDCVSDNQDPFPTDETEWVDTDGDGVGDNADLDADNDGLVDFEELARGTDSLDADSDDDGVADGSDNCPLQANGDQADLDGDKNGNACDDDSDNDGLTDLEETGNTQTNPFDADSDDDGADDGHEIGLSDPWDADTDDDFVLDSEDVFPRDFGESKDADNDAVGDNGDNCKTAANASQSNVDKDASGDACDADDDNDGLSDVLEASIGSSPIDTDSDDDGLTDWFGGAKNGGEDGCLLLASGDHADGDGDGFGLACDCNDAEPTVNPAVADTPDPTGIDHNCDGIDGDPDEAVFVNGTTGDDSNPGTRTSPQKTLQSAGRAALALGRNVYVADGVYALGSSYSVPSGVFFYGGFSGDFTAHDVVGTAIISEGTNVLLSVAHAAAGTGFSGFTLSAPSGGSPVVMEVFDSTLTLADNIIEAGNASHATGLIVSDSLLTLTDNEIRISAQALGNQGTGIRLDSVSGTMSGNQIRVENFDNRIGIECVGAGNDAISLSGNTIDVWDLPPDPLAPLAQMVYIRDCAQTGSSLHYKTADGFALPGFIDAGGNLLDGLF